MIGYLRTLLLFSKRQVRVQPLRELMAVAGVAAGVALLFTVQVAHRSITGSFKEIAHGVAGHASLELAARRPEGFDQHVVREVEAIPGVKAAAPVFDQPIVAVGTRGKRALTLVGATEQIIVLGGRLSAQFQRAAEASHAGLLVLTQSTAEAIGAKPGQDVTILIAGRRERLALSAIVSSTALGAAAGSPVAAAQLPVVQAITGRPGAVTRVLIQPQAGQERALRRLLAARFGQINNIRPVETEASLLGNAAGPEKQVTLLFSAISLVAGIILAYSALLLASDERRRFVVYLIEIGTPDSMIVASLALDAFVLGTLGSVLGLAAGDAISLFAYRSVPGYLAAAFPVGGERIVELQTIGLAIASGMFAALVATALPSISVLRAGATAEPDAVGRALTFARRMRVSDVLLFVSGTVLIGTAIVLAAVQPATTVAALILLALGLVLCLPMLARYLLQGAQRASRHLNDPSAQLSVAELRASARSVALLATGAIAVFLTVMIGGSVGDVQRAVRTGAADLLSSATLWVKPGGPENVYTTQPFQSHAVEARLRRLSSVSSVRPWRDAFVDLPGRRVWLVGVPPDIPTQIIPSQLVEGSLRTADRRLQEGGWVALSRPLAVERHLHLGERFTLPTPSGAASFRLAATTANYGWLPGAIVMNGNDRARLWQSGEATQLAVTLKSGTPVSSAKKAIERGLPQSSALVIKTAAERRSEVSAVLGSTLSRLNDTTLVVLVATIASVIALIVAASSQRRARIDSLISIGMSFVQFVRLIFYESGSMLLTGCVIGMAVGLVGQDLIDRWLGHTTGAPVRFQPAWNVGLRMLAIACGISLAASAIAALRTLRLQPRASFSTE